MRYKVFVLCGFSFAANTVLLLGLSACHQKAVMEKRPEIKEVEKPSLPPKETAPKVMPEKKVAQPQPKDNAPYEINTLVRQLYPRVTHRRTC